MSHQYGPTWPPQPPSRSNTGWSVVWTLVPLFTCGIGTPFIMAHAAHRLRSPALVFAAVIYGLGIGLFVASTGIDENIHPVPVWLEATSSIGLFGSWLGGLGHALIIRGAVFRQHTPPVPGPPPMPVPAPAPAPAPAMPYPATPTMPSQMHLPAPRPQTHHSQAHHAQIHHAQINHAQTHHTRIQQHTGIQHTQSPQGWLGPYRLIGNLGKGGQGTVHLALTPQGQKVAIKVLHEHFNHNHVVRERFLREVEATRRVATFSTARVLDVNINDDQAYIVSEYVDGVSLEQLIRERGPHNEDGLTRLALSTAGALAAIHRAGVVHRDFKPANVLIGADGPRVIDFGIARALDQVTATSGNIMGTPAYMSPEQLAGSTVGPESDVFSWAATMIFAASGRAAFGEDTIPAILNRVLNHHPDLSALPQSLRPLAAACLDKQPANRPTAADIMLRIVH
ncbi:serine/threonine-protein kinase [Streptosporangium sp. NPDC000396]|uniref:serine/threonine-protein kinase n=1 Tax=Streptosporangium sp. NPDC000396 TaxID=3366185 RepID=UPI0036A5BC8A